MPILPGNMYEGVCEDFGRVGFLVVCFLHNINPNPPKKYLLWGKKVGPNATFTPIFLDQSYLPRTYHPVRKCRECMRIRVNTSSPPSVVGKRSSWSLSKRRRWPRPSSPYPWMCVSASTSRRSRSMPLASVTNRNPDKTQIKRRNWNPRAKNRPPKISLTHSRRVRIYIWLILRVAVHGSLAEIKNGPKNHVEARSLNLRPQNASQKQKIKTSES